VEYTCFGHKTSEQCKKVVGFSEVVDFMECREADFIGFKEVVDRREALCSLTMLALMEVSGVTVVCPVFIVY